ncbi:MAG: SurA N-terminal domain-containing protein [Pseudomonadota bacterium]
MLQSMRTAVSSWTIKVMLSALILSFISFYGWSAGQGCNPHIAATVNGDSISMRDLEERFQSFLYNYRNLGLLKDDASDEVLAAIRGSVLNGMINQELKVQSAKKMGLRVPEEAVRDVIRQQFQTSKGDFDFDTYKRILAVRLHKTPAAYEEAQYDYLLAQRFDDVLAQSAYVTTDELKQSYAVRNEKVNLSFVELDAAKVRGKLRKPAAPSTAEIAKYYKEREAAYRKPETRKLQVAWINLGDLAEPADADLKTQLTEAFPDSKDEAATGPRFRASQILLHATVADTDAKRAAAETIYARVKKGERFEDVARAESEDPSRTEGGDVGYFGKGQMVKPFEDSAFALKVGEISKPVQSKLGFHIIKVTDKIPAGEAGVDRLKKELVYRYKQGLLRSRTGQEQLVARAQSALKELKAKALSTGTLKNPATPAFVHVAETGFVSDRDKVPQIPDQAQVFRTAAPLAKGAVSDPVHGLLARDLFMVRVVDIRPAVTPPIESVKNQIAADMVKQGTEGAASQYARDLLKKWIAGGKPINQLAKAEGFAVQETGEFAHEADNRIPKIGTSESAMNQAFALTEKQPWLAEPLTFKDKTYLAALKQRVPADWKKFDENREELRKVASEELAREEAQEWMISLRAHAKIHDFLDRRAGAQPISQAPPLDE